MRLLATALFLFAGLVNLAPVTGVVSASRLQALYGIAFEEPNLVVLMRHRAVLLGLVGALVVAAAFHPPLRAAAVITGMVSMLSFVLLAWRVAGLDRELTRVVVWDLVASGALLAGAVAGALSAAPAEPS